MGNDPPGDSLSLINKIWGGKLNKNISSPQFSCPISSDTTTFVQCLQSKWIALNVKGYDDYEAQVQMESFN